jgi:hypothetical protein
MPGFGNTGAADPTEDKERHAMVTMKHFNLFKFSEVSNLFILFFSFGGSARTTKTNGEHGLVRARGVEALASMQSARRKRADGIEEE